VIVEKNVIRDSRDDGLEIRFYPYQGKRRLDIIVRENIITGSGEDGIQVIDHPGPSNRLLRIERNVINESEMAAIGFMDGAKTREDYRAAAIPDRILVVGNTIVDNLYGLTGGGNLLVINNVFARTEKTALLGAKGGAVAAHNLFWKNGRDHRDSNVVAAGTLRKDPLLDGQARLKRGSPCVDAGVATFKWKGRTVLELPRASYSGAAPDLGAFERR
jgi:hypothetical protein